MGLIVKHDNGFFTMEEVEAIAGAITRTNEILVAPFSQTGELIFCYRIVGEDTFTTAYHATLEEGAGGSCAQRKIDTLIAHPKYNATGQIPAAELAEGEVNDYGGIRVFAEVELDADIAEKDTYEFLIAFSDRKEWQDELYVATVYEAMDSLFAHITIEYDDLDDDPVIGTARNIISEAVIVY